MNKVFLTGRLGKDVELRYSQAGMPFASFSIAVDASYSKDGQKIDKAYWFDISCAGSLAETASKFLSKGNKVLVEGNLEVQEWQDRESGQNRSKVVIRAQRFEFLTPRNENNGGNNDGNYGGQNAPQNRQNQPNQPQNRQGNNQGNNSQGQWNRNGNQNWNGQNNQGYGNYDAENLGPAFPSEAAGMDDVPF